MVRILSAGRLLLVALAFGSAPAIGQTTDQTTPPANNWGIGCTATARNAPLDCVVSQTVVEANSGRLLAMVRIRVPGDTKSPVMLVQMPLGIYLPAGIALSIDGATPTALAFQTCDANGCYAGMPVTPAFLATILKGQKLNLTVQDQSRQSSSVPISLAGLAQAYGHIQ